MRAATRARAVAAAMVLRKNLLIGKVAGGNGMVGGMIEEFLGENRSRLPSLEKVSEGWSRWGTPCRSVATGAWAFELAVREWLRGWSLGVESGWRVDCVRRLFV